LLLGFATVTFGLALVLTAVALPPVTFASAGMLMAAMPATNTPAAVAMATFLELRWLFIVIS
jgi:hypothetical protein